VVPPHIRPRKRALIVNCYADETRRPVRRSGKVPQSLAPAFLAGGFNPDRWELHLHNEHVDGPLEDPALLGWPDVLVLTGLTTSIDRMRQVTAYARTRNPRVVVIGGGHVARAFPSFCATFMDVVCQGDADEIGLAIADQFGAEYAAEVFAPRIDLVHWMGRIGYAESTKYCNFKCSFCVLTAEHRGFAAHPLDAFREQLKAVGKRQYVIFIDNNFHGNNRASFLERLAVVKERWQAGQFLGWAALVTGDFFAKSDNLRLVREAGCIGLFSGVESFSTEWTSFVDKRQNLGHSPVEMIRGVLEAGMIFEYGVILDIYERPIADIRREIDFMLGCDDITLPAFLSLPIPYPGTPYFYNLLDRGALLPATKVRDLDSTTICARPLDGLEPTARFVRDLQTMAGYRIKVVRHAARFVGRWHRTLNRDQLIMGLANNLLMMAPLAGTLPRSVGARRAPRTYVSSSEPLDIWYEPAMPVDARWAAHFKPVMLTDADGALDSALADDIERARPRRRPVHSPVIPMERVAT
jgi:radical SAM superfamily enzyme YgiQ (UPF0313 family)